MKKLLFVVLAVPAAWLVGCATTPNQSTTYYRDAPGYTSQPVYVQPAPQRVYAPAPQEDYNKKIIKQGLIGAGVGAIAAEASGGKAGTGALVGAGTNVLGGALLDMLTAPSTQPPPPQYVPYIDQWNAENPNNKRIVRKFDSNGNVVSEEVFTR